MPVHFKAVSTALLSIVLFVNCLEEEKSTTDDELQTVELDAEVEESENGSDSTCLYKTTVLDSLEIVSENIGFSGGDLLSLFEGGQLHHAVYATEYVTATSKVLMTSAGVTAKAMATQMGIPCSQAHWRFATINAATTPTTSVRKTTSRTPTLISRSPVRPGIRMGLWTDKSRY